MIIKALAENTATCEDFKSEHGLSIYIEAKNHKILFDTGASDLFLENAKKLDVNIEEVEYLVISHGHYDHGGGLKAFFERNKKAEVFINKLAFKNYFSEREEGKLKYIGLDDALKSNSRFISTKGRFFISEGIETFSDVIKKEPLPTANSRLFAEEDGLLVKDNFLHEQNMVIEENGKLLLLTGCAHNGIINIIEHFYSLKGRMPDYVIGGFHLSGRFCNESDEIIEKTGRYLINTNAKFFTCHCTGIEPYNKLKNIMGDKIDYISAGSQILL